VNSSVADCWSSRITLARILTASHVANAHDIFVNGASVRIGRVAALRADDRQFDALKRLGLGILTWFAVRVAPAADFALASWLEIVHERRKDRWLDVLAHAFIIALNLHHHYIV